MATKRKLFLSYRNGIDTAAWIELAYNLLKEYYDVYDYKERKDIAAGSRPISEALIEKLQETDIVVCLVDKEYFREPYTILEFETAIKRSTGSATGLLTKQVRKPLIKIIAIDEPAIQWLRDKHDDFPPLVFDDYQFRDDVLVPKNGTLWENLRDSMNARLDELERAKQAGTLGQSLPMHSEKPPNFAFLRRPSGAFGAKSAALAMTQSPASAIL